MKSMVLVLTFFFSIQASADPKHIEAIFLSAPKYAQVLWRLEERLKLKSMKVAINDCVPMGNGCFHPQLGFIEDRSKETAEPTDLIEEKLELKTFNSTDVNLVECKKDYHFDLFCGQEKSKPNLSGFEIWMDNSSSMKNVDRPKEADYCDRRIFLEKMAAKCPAKMRMYMFNTSFKEADGASSACLNIGMNDSSKLVRWLKESQAKNVLLITDMEENYGELREYLQSQGAKIHGDGVVPFTTKELVDNPETFTGLCD